MTSPRVVLGERNYQFGMNGGGAEEEDTNGPEKSNVSVLSGYAKGNAFAALDFSPRDTHASESTVFNEKMTPMAAEDEVESTMMMMKENTNNGDGRNDDADTQLQQMEEEELAKGNETKGIFSHVDSLASIHDGLGAGFAAEEAEKLTKMLNTDTTLSHGPTPAMMMLSDDEDSAADGSGAASAAAAATGDEVQGSCADAGSSCVMDPLYDVTSADIHAQLPATLDAASPRASAARRSLGEGVSFVKMLESEFRLLRDGNDGGMMTAASDMNADLSLGEDSDEFSLVFDPELPPNMKMDEVESKSAELLGDGALVMPQKASGSDDDAVLSHEPSFAFDAVDAAVAEPVGKIADRVSVDVDEDDDDDGTDTGDVISDDLRDSDAGAVDEAKDDGNTADIDDDYVLVSKVASIGSLDDECVSTPDEETDKTTESVEEDASEANDAKTAADVAPLASTVVNTVAPNDADPPKARNGGGGGAIRAVVNFFESLAFTPKTDKKVSRVPTKPKGGNAIVPSSISKKLSMSMDDKLVCMSPFVCLSQKKKSVFNVESVSTLSLGDDDDVDAAHDNSKSGDEVSSSSSMPKTTEA